MHENVVCVRRTILVVLDVIKHDIGLQLLFLFLKMPGSRKIRYTIWPEGIIIAIFDIKIETSGFGGLPN